MKKLIAKLIGGVTALAMAIGVGVAVANNKVEKVDADGPTCTLVTDISDLSSGDSIIIGNGVSGTVKFLSTTQNSNNRGATSGLTVSNGNVSLPNDAEILTLGTSSTYWTLYANGSASGYLYAASSSSNYLRTRATDSDGNSRWTISITDAGVASITAQGSFTRNQLKNNGNLFACYASGQTAVSIYKVPASTAEVDTVSATLESKTYYAGSTLLASDFSLTVTWTEGKDPTNPTSGFTWTVNGVENGTLAVGNNVVVVTYESVSSANINVQAIADTRWDTEFSNTMVANIELPNEGDTDSKYYVVAKINSITDTTHGNGTAEDENGTEFAIYGMYNFNGQVRYDNMRVEQKPVANDIAVLYGVFTKYNDAPEIKNAWVVQLNGTVFEAPALTGVSLNKSTLDLERSQQFTLKASPNPADAELGNVVWNSTDESVATVNSSGKVTAVGAGVATISATAGGFTAECAVSVVLKSVFDLSTNQTISASASLLLWANNEFMMRLDRNGDGNTAANNYYGGDANNRSSTRFYGNQLLTVQPDSLKVNAVKAVFSATTDNYATAFVGATFNNATAVADGKKVTVTFTDGTKPFTALIKNQCGFDSVEIIYEEASAKQKVENTETIASLYYQYHKNDNDEFTYSNVAIRFGVLLNKTIWAGLENIQGYGVLVSTEDEIETAELKTFYDEAEAGVGGADYFYKPLSEKAEPSTATAAQKGDLEGDYYIWNVFYNIPSNALTNTYVAVGFVKTSTEIIFFKEIRTFAAKIANDLILAGTDAGSADGSLQNLANMF